MNLMTVFFWQDTIVSQVSSAAEQVGSAAGQVGSTAVQGDSLMQQYSSWILLVGMVVVFYFFMIRPQNKKQKEITNFRKSLQVNQKVITAGGIHGIIKEINDNDVVLEVASNVKIHIDKNSIFAAAADASSSQASK